MGFSAEFISSGMRTLPFIPKDSVPKLINQSALLQIIVSHQNRQPKFDLIAGVNKGAFSVSEYEPRVLEGGRELHRSQPYDRRRRQVQQGSLQQNQLVSVDCFSDVV